MTFSEKLQRAWDSSGSLVCVGLDIEAAKLPRHLQGEPDAFLSFGRAIIDATAPYVCAWKPQFAHYAGQDQLPALRGLCAYIKERYPDRLLILDSKRGDIGNTARYYAQEAFAIYGADALTANPYMGGDTLEAFTADPEYGVFILAKTSNPGSAEFQDLECGDQPLYLHVAEAASRRWNQHRNVGLVVGATYPSQLQAVRERAGDLPFLVPGIGAQGGDLEATLRAGRTADGRGLLINSSRGVLYASGDRDFAQAAAREAEKLHHNILSIN